MVLSCQDLLCNKLLCKLANVVSLDRRDACNVVGSTLPFILRLFVSFVVIFSIRKQGDRLGLVGQFLDCFVELLEARAVVASSVAVQAHVAVCVYVRAIVKISFSRVRFMDEVPHERVVVLAIQTGALVHACCKASITVLFFDQVRLDLFLGHVRPLIIYPGLHVRL